MTYCHIINVSISIFVGFGVIFAISIELVGNTKYTPSDYLMKKGDFDEVFQEDFYGDFNFVINVDVCYFH